MPALLNHTNARWLALISTGNVIKLKRVVMAKRQIPANNNCGKVFTIKIPASNTQVIIEDENCTTGTKAERIFSGAYARACCTDNYDTVQVWQKPDYENLTRAVIRSEIDETEEFSLINDYYAAQLSIETDEDRKAKAVADYKAHLSRVIAIKTMVKNDLLTEGY